MAKMYAALGAVNIVAAHDVTGVERGSDRALHRRIEARPAAAALILGLGFEQFRATTGAKVSPIPFLVVQRAGPGAFCAGLAQHTILLGRELVLPVFLGLGVGHAKLHFDSSIIRLRMVVCY